MIIHCKVVKIEKDSVIKDSNDNSEYWEWLDKTEKALYKSCNKNKLKK